MRSISSASIIFFLGKLHFSSTFTLLQYNRCLSIGVPSQSPLRLLNDDAIDVEFEKQTQNKKVKKNQSSNIKSHNAAAPKPFLDAAFETQNESESANVPISKFIDPEAKTGKYIDCKILAVVEMDGMKYTIGTPCEDQVAIFCEGRTPNRKETQQEEQEQNWNFFIDPDKHDNLPLMELAAKEFHEKYGTELGMQLKRNPRTLTVEGDLDAIANDESLKSIEGKENQLLDDISGSILGEINRDEDDTEDDEFFDNFFKRELGENYEEEVLGSDAIMDRELEDLMDLFSVPGMGTDRDDEEGIKAMLDDIYNGNDLKKAIEFNDNNQDEPDNTAMRLIGFEGPDGNAYSLMRLTQPMILVAREHPKLDKDQRILLTTQEAEAVIPRLEKKFMKDLVP